MAKTLKTYDRIEDSEIPAGRPKIYPWEDWFNGQIWLLSENEDYEIPTDSMMNYIRKCAMGQDFKTSVYLHTEHSIVIKPR